VPLYVGKGRSFEHDHTHYVDEVGDGVEPCDALSPHGHGLYGCEEAGHEDEDDHDEPCDEHRLLLGVGICGDDEADGECDYEVEGCEEEYEPDASDDGYVEDDLADGKAEGEFEERYDEEGNELADDEFVFPDGGDVDLLDCAYFLFLDDAHCREKQSDEGDEESHDTGDHEGDVVELGVEPVPVADADDGNGFGLIHVDHVYSGFDVEVRKYVLRVGRDDAGGGTVYRVDEKLHFGFVVSDEVFLEVGRDDDYELRFAVDDLLFRRI